MIRVILKLYLGSMLGFDNLLHYRLGTTDWFCGKEIAKALDVANFNQRDLRELR